MFFEKENLSFRLLDVLRIKQRDIHCINKGRHFNALSFRLYGDTELVSDQKTHHVTDHCLAYVPSGVDYERRSRSEEMIVVHFDTTDYYTRDIECFYPADAAAFEALFLRIWETWTKKDLGYQYRCAAILYEIFALAYAQNFTSSARSSKIQASVDYMMQHFKKTDLTMEEIAEKSFISQVYFRRLFKKEYGMSPQKYIIHLRIQHAKGLIATGYYSLKEAAVMSGYMDYKYFAVEFKKNTGVSPSEYLYNY